MCLMKHNVRTLDVKGHFFQYICSKLPGLSYEKIKTDIFDGLQISLLMRNLDFISPLYSAGEVFICDGSQ